MSLAVQPWGDFSQWLPFEQCSLMIELKTSGKRERMGIMSNFFSEFQVKKKNKDYLGRNGEM